MNKIVVNFFGTALLGATALCLLPPDVEAKEITVPSGSILTIQDAVAAAAPGDTIVVQPGTYGNVYIGPDKTGLQLLAAGPPGSVRVVGVGTLGWNVGIEVDADGASVQGFTISNATYGIRTVSTSRGVRIIGNWIGDLAGQHLRAIRVETCAKVEVAQNTFFGRIDGDGIDVYQASSIHVHDNSAGDCSLTGNFISLTGSTGCEIDHNLMEDASVMDSGIFLNGWLPAGPNTQHYIHHNRMNHAGQGIFSWLSPDCVLEHNVCDNNGIGIYLQGSPDWILDYNEANNNGLPASSWGGGIVIGDSPGCTVSYNKANDNVPWGITAGGSCGSTFAHNSATGNALLDLNDGADLNCNSYLDNRAQTAWPSLALWDVK